MADKSGAAGPRITIAAVLGAIAGRFTAAEALLRRDEWGERGSRCWLCKARQCDGHLPECGLGEALEALEGWTAGADAKVE